MTETWLLAALWLGMALIAACLINDLGIVLALGLIFGPFSMRTLIFAGVSVIVFALFPYVIPRFFKRYSGRPSELEAKYLLLCLFWHGVSGGLGRQRSGSAGVSDRHGPCRRRGESFMQRWLVGSAAKRILSYASCTVMIVR